MDLKLFVLGLMALQLVAAFNDGDNYDGYNGHCPRDWIEIDQFCYRKRNKNRNFRESLRECTSSKDNYHMYWEQGSRWIGPRFNLMPVEHLHSLLEHGQNAGYRLGRGPYRVNAIKTNHDDLWREYDGGDTNIDVYRWTGGRLIDFNMFPDFDPEWGSAGDTLVWYPRSNRLYARPHYHEYDSLCWRRKDDAERCPGVPQCNYNGDCYNGKCFCYRGWVGEDCCCKPKLLIAGGSNPGTTFVPGDYAELFDLETMTSCVHSMLPDNPWYAGEMAMLGGEVYHCGGGDIDPATNKSLCYQWSRKDQTWATDDLVDTLRPLQYLDSVIVQHHGWWLNGGIIGTGFIHSHSEILPYHDRSQFVTETELPEYRIAHCSAQISTYRTAIIGGAANPSVPVSTYVDNINIYDWKKESWLTAAIPMPGDIGGSAYHDCEVLIDPECGHPIVIVFGGVTGNSYSKTWAWDSITDEFFELGDNPAGSGVTVFSNYYSLKLYDDTVAIIGGDEDDVTTRSIYTYRFGEGYTKIGDMLEDRKDPSAVVVWGEDFYCPDPEIVPPPP